MTDDEIRIAIAESQGWKWYRRPATGPWAAKPHRSLYHPELSKEYVETVQLADMTERQCNEVFIFREGFIPNYPSDLNAMHEVEKEFDDRHKYSDDTRSLYYDYLALNSEGFPDKWEICWTVLRATARQRAEAYLKVKGLWKE